MKPDFNYPKTVAERAESNYEKYLNAGDGLKALQEAVKFSIARGLISRDSLNASIEKFSTLSKRLKAPYDKIALMLEAEEYLSIYKDDAFSYSRRKLPMGVYPENVMEWSKDLFAARVDSLLRSATSDISALSQYKLSALKGLIDDKQLKQDEQAGMTVADFVTARSAGMLGEFMEAGEMPLRFGDVTGAVSPEEACGQRAMALIEDGIARNTEAGNVRLASWFSKMKYDRIPQSSALQEWLSHCLSEYSDTPYGAWAIDAKVSGMIFRRQGDPNQPDTAEKVKALELIKQYINKFPNAEGVLDLKRLASSIEEQQIVLKHSNQELANTPWNCEIEASNIYNFKILIYRLSDSYYKKGSIKLQDAISNGRLAGTVPIDLPGKIPAKLSTKETMPALAPGLYVMFPSTNGAPSGVLSGGADPYGDVFRVSNLSYFVTSAEDGGELLYVTDARTQQPVEGATVTRIETVYNRASKTTRYKTGADGCVLLPQGNADLRVSLGADCITGNYYRYSRYTDSPKFHLDGKVLTDLSIYKPGQKMQFAGAVWQTDSHIMKEAGEMSLTALLFDANYQKVDTLEISSDRFGRYSGSFKIPETGLLGNYHVQIVAGTANVGNGWFEVADYKSPTFLVELTGAEGEYNVGDTIRLKGKALTYSGMPVAGGDVKFTVNYRQWRNWWYGGMSSAECGGSTATDGDGNFVIELPTANLKGTPYEEGIFILSANVTNGAGETQEAQPIVFSLGRAYTLEVSMPSMINAGDVKADISVGVNDMTGHPVDKPVYFAINDGDKNIASGLYEKAGFLNLLLKQPSGEYNIVFSLNEPADGSDEADRKVNVIVWRNDDAVPATKTPLWVPVKNIITSKGEPKAEITVGSSFEDSYVFMLVSNSQKIIDKRWIKIDKANRMIELDAPAADERLFVTFVGMHDLDRKSEKVTIIPYEQTIKVKIATESFRDKLTPGDKEQWKFRFTVDGVPMENRPVMAVMTNKALNAIAPFQWSFNPAGALSWNNPFHISMRDYYKATDTFTKYKEVKGYSKTPLQVPSWEFYGYPLTGWMVVRNYMLYSMSAPMAAKSRKMESNDSDDMVFEESEVMIRGNEAGGVEEAKADEGNTEDNMQMRPVEMPLAFFMPGMITDNDGIAEVKFEVPQFNGTWQFQIAGYDKDMHGAVATYDAVASKQVMVQMNAPRFLRTGDKAQISATLFNNSGEAILLSGKIEIVDPVSGKVLTVVEPEATTVKACGSEVITALYDVPSDLSAVIVRAYAKGNGHTDGEQTDVAILPSSTPVLESRPFYVAPGKQTISVKMPENSEDANVTLQYCGNPIWECVTALPEIMTPSSSNILAQINALYGMSIADGLMGQYPALRDAIATFAAPENAEDSTLVSNLEKNGNLKLTALNNTPWVNAASDETARMQSLVKYLDRESAKKQIEGIMKVLADRQNTDGGWCWCDGMPTSTFVTGRVLLHFSMLKGMGNLPQGAAQMAEKAFRYMDKELVADWKRTNPRTFNVNLLLNYLYVKSFFADFKDSDGFEALRAEAMKAIAKDWGKFSIYDKATAVTLEWRSGNSRLAGEILESLRQYASVNEEKGMWFDNLSGGWSGWNPLITTAQVLEAYSEVSPKDAAVDQLRQWLLMSKQTQDWGEMNGTAEVVQAILGSGSDWTKPGKEAKVKVNGRAVEIPHRAKLTDSFTVTLTPQQVRQGNIKIEKYSDGPAWGGIVSQYVAPILEVKADAIPQLSIRKEVFAIAPDGAVSGNAEGLKVGDMVRITLTINCDRDLDYVAVTDSRSTCLEPAEQLSGYTASDGTWYYQETTNEGTNLFIPFLSKGTHVVNYECYVDRAGEYTAGIASAQSQYAPVISAHSAGMLLKVSPK